MNAKKRRLIAKLQRQNLLCDQGTSWDFPELISRPGWTDYRGKVHKRFDKRHLSYRELIDRRFDVVSIQVRCINKMHKITLSNGRLRLHGHPDLKAKLMLGFMSKDCRCLTVLKQWQVGAVNELPDGLKKAAKGRLVTRRALNRKLDDEPVPNILQWMKEDFSPCSYVPRGSLMMKAFKRALMDCLRKTGIYDDLMVTRIRDGIPDKFKIDMSGLYIYRDLCISAEQLKKVREHQGPSLQVCWNGERLQIAGDIYLSWLSLYKQGKVIEDGRVFCGVDDGVHRYYLKKEDENHSWYQGAYRATKD